MKTGDEAFHRLVRDYEFRTVLDVGCGESQPAARAFRDVGNLVTTIDRRWKADLQADYLDAQFQPVDAIWCCHVLEHQLQVHAFLMKLRYDLEPGGVLALTVPPLKHAIVGGHVSLWNEGLLLYRLVLAGWDCSEARVGVYGYNISVLVRRRDADLPELDGANGDLERLAPYFPVPVHQGIDGRLGNVRW